MAIFPQHYAWFIICYQQKMLPATAFTLSPVPEASSAVPASSLLEQLFPFVPPHSQSPFHPTIH